MYFYVYESNVNFLPVGGEYNHCLLGYFDSELKSHYFDNISKSHYKLRTGERSGDATMIIH